MCWMWFPSFSTPLNSDFAGSRHWNCVVSRYPFAGHHSCQMTRRSALFRCFMSTWRLVTFCDAENIRVLRIPAENGCKMFAAINQMGTSQILKTWRPTMTRSTWNQSLQSVDPVAVCCWFMCDEPRIIPINPHETTLNPQYIPNKPIKSPIQNQRRPQKICFDIARIFWTSSTACLRSRCEQPTSSPPKGLFHRFSQSDDEEKWPVTAGCVERPIPNDEFRTNPTEAFRGGCVVVDVGSGMAARSEPWKLSWCPSQMQRAQMAVPWHGSGVHQRTPTKFMAIK